jgi:lambda family phage minor tail protein L
LIMGIEQDVRKAWHDGIVELFELDLSSLTGDNSDKYYFTKDIFPDGRKVRWKGKRYEPFPIEITGFETTTKGTIPQPELTVANVLGTLASVTNSLDDLVGAKITRRRTLGKYLDNGVSPNPNEEFPEDVYYIERKTSETNLTISWQLASKIDLEGLQLPRRVVTQNYCIWEYRGAGCEYAGPPIADARDRFLEGDSQEAKDYIDALRRFNNARNRERNALYERNLAAGRRDIACAPGSLPIRTTYSDLRPPEYSFAIKGIVGGLIFGIVEGVVKNLTITNPDYRETRTVKTGFEIGDENNGTGPVYQIDEYQGGALVASYYSISYPVSFALDPWPNVKRAEAIGIVNGQIVPLVESGDGFRRGVRRSDSIGGVYALGLVNKSVTRCQDAEQELQQYEAAFQAARTLRQAREAELAAAAAALPQSDELYKRDICGKRLNSCKLRFGSTDLPFGGFPGANLTR